jgi:HlyD family secretion protein
MRRMHALRVPAALAVCLGVLAATGCARRPAATAQQPPYVQTSVAQLGTIDPASSVSGIIAPYESVAVQSDLSEPADDVYVHEGERVHKGEVLAQLDTADLRAQLAADLATAKSDAASTEHSMYAGNQLITQGNQSLTAAQANLVRDQNILERDAKLFHQGYVSEQQYQVDQATVRNDESNLRSAQATVQANGANLAAPGLQSSSVEQSRAQEQVALAQAQQIRVQIAKATIVSPIDGVVVNRNLNPGEYPGTRQIFTLQQVSPLYAVLRGSSEQIAGIVPGTPATIAASGEAGRTIRMTGKVTGVLNEIQPGSTQFQVKVLLENPHSLLRPGMAVDGSVALPPVRGVKIPVTAFTDDNHDAIQIVQPNSTVKTVHVTEVASDGAMAVVSGVGSGTRVVSNGQSSVGDGEKVSYQP